MTNSLTGSAVSAVTITTDPAMAGVSITTDASGNYSAQLPIAVYTLTFKAANFTQQTATVSVAAGESATKNIALVPTTPVAVNTTVTGDRAPGQTVTAAATVVLLDGSSLVSTTWTQTSGVTVGLQPGGQAADGPVSGATVQVALPNVTAFKDEFFRIVDEERKALLDRYMVMGITPLDLEETARVVLEVTVVTSKGTYKKTVNIDAELPFNWSAGIRNVPVGIAVLLHGKDKPAGQGYNWTVAAPAGSVLTALEDPTTQNPYLTPDAEGKYTVTESISGTRLDVYAGSFEGAIGPTGQPSTLCTVCHDGRIAPDTFTPWKASGHAEIFTQNLNAGGHYGTGCFTCHTVGYYPGVSNNGIDDQPQYAAFLTQFFPNGGSPSPNPQNWTNMLAQFPGVAKFANIQCENCHGPNGSEAHRNATDGTARLSLSSDVCGVCHGEPARHGRFQQWQESGHANYELAIDEATVESRGAIAGHCGRCHSGQGFLAWIKQGDLTKRIQGASGDATVQELTALGLTKDTVHTQTCTTCHSPHAQGHTSGEPNTATVRIMDNTPLLPAGYAALAVGRGAVCITCHNTRNGAHNDEVGNPTTYSAPHAAAQGDVLMGQNAYFVSIGDRSPHSFIADTCATCHLELTPPPPEFSFSGAGTNHSFRASLTICTQCHGVFDGGTLQESAEQELEALAEVMSEYLRARITAAGTIFIKDYTPHVFDGASYDVKSANVQVATTSIAALEPTEPHGQQGFIVKFTAPVEFTYSPTGQAPHSLMLNQAEVQLGDFTTDGTAKLIPADNVLVRAGWNYFLIHGDGSKGVHNPSFTFTAIGEARARLEEALEVEIPD